jgi:hypothetical protein
MNYTIKTAMGDVDVEAEPVEIPLPDGRILDALVFDLFAGLSGLDVAYVVSAGGFRLTPGIRDTPEEAIQHANEHIAEAYRQLSPAKIAEFLAAAGVVPRWPTKEIPAP